MAISAGVVMYLQRPAGGFWAWDEDARSVSFVGGGTIAFRQQFHQVVKQLSGRGLPPFGAIVLLLAACRGNWKAVGRTRLPEELLGALDHRTREKLLSGLEVVAGLPETTWREPRRLAVLAQMVFERVRPVTTPAVATDVMKTLAADMDPEGLMVAETSGGDARTDFALAAAALAEGLEGVSAERLDARVRTGLDVLPSKADEEQAGLAGRVRALIDALTRDPELSALARLARDVLAAVHVPKLVGPREELAVGGVSDLSNHGPLDRLVLTELAYDDLTLAVRVAMNEAIYVKREPPAAPPPRTRVIVLDAGIRMWGMPRVFATAVGMALAATAERTADVSVYRAAPGETADALAAVDLGTREGLVTHLSALEPSPQPAASLVGVMGRHPEDADVILVTHPDAAADPDFGRTAQRCGGRPWYLVTVDRDGRFRMDGVTPAGRRPVREAVLNLAEILAGPPDARPATPVEDKRRKDLPAILNVRPFPLRLPYHPLPVRSCATQEGGLVAATTSDQRLLFWPRLEAGDAAAAPSPAGLMNKVVSQPQPVATGAIQLSDRVPPGKLLSMTVDEEVPVARVLTVHGVKGVPTYHLMGARLDGTDETHVRLATTLHPVQGAAFQKRILYLFGREVAEMFQASTGARMGSVRLPAGAAWVWGRFVRAQGRHWAICYGAGASTLTMLSHDGLPTAVRVFEFEGADAPVALLSDGTVRSLEPSNGYEVRWPSTAAKLSVTPLPVISPDGRRLVVTAQDGSRYALDVGTAERQWRKTSLFMTEEAMRPAWGNTAGARGVLRGMLGYVCRNSAGLLTLAAPKRRWGIELEGHDLWLRRNVPHNPVGQKVSFKRLPRRNGVAYDLYEAVWPNGSKAVLDRRGLLHLKGADPEMPEVTLVLASDGPMAGWSSDGKVFGPEYFHGQKVSWVGSHLEGYVRRFAEGLP